MARKGAGGLEAADRRDEAIARERAEKIAARKKRQGIADGPDIKGASTDKGEMPGQSVEEVLRGDEPAAPSGRSVPDAGDLERNAARAVARGRTNIAARERMPLSRAPRASQDPTVALITALGETRGRRQARRLNEAGDAFEAERFDDARRILEPLVGEVPTLPEGRELLGLTYYRLGKWKKATDELELFREMTSSTEQHPVLADAYRALGRWADVDELWAELGSVSPSADLVTEGRIVVAGSLADRGDIEGAVRLLEKGWKVPKGPRSHHLRRAYALADLYEQLGRVPRAREMFSWVASHDPDLADVRDRVRALS